MSSAKELVDYGTARAAEKRKELVDDADSQPAERMSDYDRGWLSGYIAAMANIRNEAERMEAREQERWNSSMTYDEMPVSRRGRRTNRFVWTCVGCKTQNAPGTAECVRCGEEY